MKAKRCDSVNLLLSVTIKPCRQANFLILFFGNYNVAMQNVTESDNAGETQQDFKMTTN